MWYIKKNPINENYKKNSIKTPTPSESGKYPDQVSGGSLLLDQYVLQPMGGTNQTSQCHIVLLGHQGKEESAERQWLCNAGPPIYIVL